MSGAHCLEQKLEGVWCHSLHAPSIPSLLQEYQQLQQQLLGPKAGTMLVHHSGGIDSFVNSSRELVKRIQPHHPCIKFINSLMEAQNSAYGCLGLYVGVLGTSLLKELLLLQDNINERLSERSVKEATNVMMSRILSYLDTKPDNLVDKLDLSNLEQMLALVGTTLGSKNFNLNHEEKQHLKVKTVEAFLAAIPSKNELDVFGEVTVTVMEGQSATEAQVFEGLLYREQDPDEKVIDAIKQKFSTSQSICNQLVRSSCEIDSNRHLLGDTTSLDGHHHQLLRDENTCRVSNSVEPSSNNALGCPSMARVSSRLAISKYSRNSLDTDVNFSNTTSELEQPSFIRVALFNVPLVFEQSETECLKFTGGVSNSEVYDAVVVAKLRELVCRCRVDVIACQKVISEVIKFELQRDGVLVLERLGTTLTDSLQQLTGCVAISDVAGFLSCSNNVENEANVTENSSFNLSKVDAYLNDFVGNLTDINIVEVSGKTYLQLENSQKRTKPDEVDYNEVNRLADQDNVAKGLPVVTFLLPAPSSSTSGSLKAVVEEALQILRHAALHPLAAAAGGCFESALAHWITTNGVLVTEEPMRTVGNDDGEAAVHVTSAHKSKSDAADEVLKLDEVLAAVDSLLLEENDKDAVSELQLRQVTLVFAKVFANLAVLLSGGSNASPFDFSVDTRSSHLIPDFTSGVSYPDYAPSSTDDQPCPVKCSCGSVVPTSANNTKKPGSIDLRSLFERQPNAHQPPSQSPSHYPSKIVAPDNRNTVNALNVSHQERVSRDHVFNVTADCLVESYHAKVNAIQLAFEGVVQLLCVDYCVFDR